MLACGPVTTGSCSSGAASGEGEGGEFPCGTPADAPAIIHLFVSGGRLGEHTNTISRCNYFCMVELRKIVLHNMVNTVVVAMV